jgi:nitroreductase
MNETLQTIHRRRSVRAFTPAPVPREVLEALVLAGAAAPSPLNNQPWRFVVVQRRSCIKAIADAVEKKAASIKDMVNLAARQDYLAYCRDAVFFRNAGALIVVLLKPMSGEAREHHWGVPGYFENERRARSDILCIGAAGQNILLAAESLGYGACMMLYPLAAGDTVAALLGIEAPWEIMCFIPVGVRAGDLPPAPKRRAPERIVRYIAEEE